MKVRYRLTVGVEITDLPGRFVYLFNGRHPVPRGDYELTVDSHQISIERDIQEVARLWHVEAKIVRSFLE